MRILISDYIMNNSNIAIPTKFLFKVMASSFVSSSYFNQFLNGKPTIAELCEHIRVGTKWYTFGVLLKLDTTELDSIRVMNEDTSFKTLKMFELWLSSKPKAMRREIIETLQKPTIAENFIAEEYKRALVESELKG